MRAPLAWIRDFTPVEAGVDVGEPDAIGIGMREDVEDPRDDHAADLAAGLVDALDLEPELVERVGDVADRSLDRREIANPSERCAHDPGLRTGRRNERRRPRGS